MLEDYVEFPTWIDPVLGVITLSIMGFFAYMSAHLMSERKAGKQIPLFWEKKEEKEKKMGYGKGYSKKPVKKVKKAKKPVKKGKNIKK